MAIVLRKTSVKKQDGNKCNHALKTVLRRLYAEISKQQFSNNVGRDEVINVLVMLSKDFGDICSRGDWQRNLNTK